MIVTKSKAPAVDGAMQILQLLAQSTSSLSLSEISEESNLPYSTTHRLIDALLAHNMISIDPSEKKKYCMGAKIFQLASTVFSRQDSISIFHPIAEILKNETYNSVYLNIEVGNRTVVIAKTESSMAKASNVFIGSTFQPISPPLARPFCQHVVKQCRKLILNTSFPRDWIKPSG